MLSVRSLYREKATSLETVKPLHRETQLHYRGHLGLQSTGKMRLD